MLWFFIIATLILVTAIIIASIARKNEIAEYGDDADTMPKIMPGILTGALSLFIILMLLFGSLYTVSEDQQAVVTQFGKVTSVEGAGVHWKVPLIQKVQKVDITTHGASIGYVIDGSTQTEGNLENPQMITADFNLIDVDFYIEYKVSDPVAFLYNSSYPERILIDTAMSCIRTAVSDYNVDDVMTTAKGEIQARIRSELTEELEGRNIGIQLVNILIQDVEPPTDEVFNAFKAVESAKQQADTALNNANRYRNEKLPAAEADADKIVQSAEAAKAARIAEAEGQVSRFNKMFEEYKNFPLITKKRLFFETLEDVLPGVKIVVTDGNTTEVLPVDSFMQ